MGRKPKKKPPSFFVILLHDFTDTIKIPCEFVRKHLKGKLIENPILKTEGSSNSWVVEIKKIDENYFFNMGWSDFVQDNNLERGDFLLFWLISDSTFFVTIYDPTCCEKPFNTSTPPSPNPNTCGKEVIARMEEETNDVIVNTTKPHCQARVTKNTMSRIHLPIGFVRETGVLLKEKITMLRDEEGREWRVETCMRKNGSTFELAKGWRDFSKGNAIRESDICSFEFCRDEGNVIDVCVLNRNEKETGSTWNICATPEIIEPSSDEFTGANQKIVKYSFDEFVETNQKIVTREEETNDDKTKKTCCEVRIGKSSKYRINLSVSFVKESGLLKKKSTVLRDEDGRKWKVETCLRGDGRIFDLTKGWKDFYVGNGLKEFDVCLFEFCRGKGNLIDVHVLKKNEDISKRRKIGTRGSKSIGFKSKNPCIIRTINNFSSMALRMDFVRETGILLERTSSFLRDEEGRTWKVQTRWRKNVYVYELTAGWREFREAKGLEKGDTCMFEFRGDEGNVIDVRVLARNGGKGTGKASRTNVI